MPLPSSRLLNALAFLGCLLLMLAALYLEHVEGLEPCPLCIVQRICVLLFGLFCLAAALHNPQALGRRCYAGLAGLAAAGGLAAAWRQIWLQGLPPEELPACLPSLEYMLEALPFQDILRLVLHGTAECAEVKWTLLGMSIPEWSLLGFIGMLLLVAVQLLRRD